MTDPGVALVGLGGHQFTDDDLALAGGLVRIVIEGVDSSIEHLVDVTRAAASDPQIALVSVNLEPRRHQVAVAIAALEAGAHVLIERPAAATLADAEALEAAASRSPGRLWERATTAFDAPYRRAAELIAEGAIGEVALVTTHRSYPWAPWRAIDETISGGLLVQSAGYGLDVVRLVAGQQISRVRIVDTDLADPRPEHMRMAAILSVELESGAIASVVVDYLNPPAGPWGRDEVRILGSRGRLAIDGVTGTLTWTHPEGERTESPVDSGRGLLAAVLAAIREGGDTEPTAAELRGSTLALLRSREDPNAHRSYRAGAGWSAREDAND